MHLLLDGAGDVVDWDSHQGEGPESLGQFDLVVIDAGSKADLASQLCRRLRARFANGFVPILFVSSDREAGRITGLQSGADAQLLRPFVRGELLAQVQALLRLKRSYDSLKEESTEFHDINDRLREAYQQTEYELELARRIQLSLLPQALPDMLPARFAVRYRPCGRVGGDFYDLFRLDENHVGLYVADVVGHGLPAALLTIFLKKAVKTKEIDDRHYRLLRPDDVLQSLNRELIGQAVAENPFITMIYALFDRRDSTLAFSRAGHPHPIYVPRWDEPQLLQVHGTLLGVFDTQFTVQTQRLRPGDKVLFYTDGIGSNDNEGQQTSTERLLAALDQYRTRPIDELVAGLSRDLLEQVGPVDDFTLLGMEVVEQ